MASMHEGSASTTVAGRYRLGEKLGAGSAGVVWRAHDERLGREVAVKQLAIPPGLSDDDVARMHADAMREGRITARLDDPSVVAMLDMVIEGGCSWLVMEYVAGASLADALERGPLAPREAARVAAAVAGALAAAHAEGVVHSDVKPTNVLLGDGGVVKLADFGVAHAIRNEAVTGPDEVSGTPLYMAPEIARGARPSAASDVYSLAATLYAMVEGRSPFGSMDDGPLAVMHRVAKGDTDPIRNAGPLTAILEALFDQDPERRPTAATARERLAAVTTPVRPVTTTASPRPGVIALRTIRPGLSAAPGRAARVVPMTATPASRRPEHAGTERGASPIVPIASASRPRPGRPGVRRTRALVPLSAAGVVAVGAIAGALGSGPGLPFMQTAADLIHRVVGTDDAPVPASTPQALDPAASLPSMEGASALPVPYSAPPIVPATSDVIGDADRAPQRSAARTSQTPDSVTDVVPQLPVSADVTDDLPVAGPVVGGLLGGGGDDAVTHAVSGLTDGLGDTVSGVTGDLSGVTAGLTGDLSGVTGDLSGVTGHLSGVTGDLSGITGDLSNVTGDLTGVTGDLSHVSGNLSGVNGDLSNVTGSLSDVTGNLTHVSGDLSDVTGNLSDVTGTLSGATGDLSHVTGSLTGVTGNLSHVSGSLTGVTGNLSHVSGNLSGVTGNLSHVSGSVSDVTGDLTHASGTLTSVIGGLTGDRSGSASRGVSGQAAERSGGSQNVTSAVSDLVGGGSSVLSFGGNGGSNSGAGNGGSSTSDDDGGSRSTGVVGSLLGTGGATSSKSSASSAKGSESKAAESKAAESKAAESSNGSESAEGSSSGSGAANGLSSLVGAALSR